MYCVKCKKNTEPTDVTKFTPRAINAERYLCCMWENENPAYMVCLIKQSVSFHLNYTCLVIISQVQAQG